MDKLTKAYCKAYNITEEFFKSKLRRNDNIMFIKHYLWWTIFKYKE